jgi:hypothetical protein
VPGYPIRTPSDQRSVDSSPRTIAASHVLHRLLMPRHPPCALHNLTNTHIKKSRHKQHRNKRCSRPLYNSQRPHEPPGPTPPQDTTQRSPPKTTTPTNRVVPSGPNSAPTPVLPLSLEPPTRDTQNTRLRPPQPVASGKLLRKEVIQPHLPVRLPCYDFVPIASPTFDRSPPNGLGHGLRVLPTFVT